MSSFLKRSNRLKILHGQEQNLYIVILYTDGDITVLRIGADRGLKRTKRDFESEELEDWPSALVMINNAPDVQKMAIEVEYKAFRKARTLAAILERNLNDYLHRYLLNVTVLPVFDKYDFWEIVETYQGKITRVTFDMISPNMSNISQSLKLDLRALNRQTNTQETKLEIKSDERTSLTLSPNDEFITSLVEYSSEGGGDIGIKVKGLNKKISTNDTVTEIHIDEMETSIQTADQAREVAKIIGKFMS